MSELHRTLFLISNLKNRLISLKVRVPIGRILSNQVTCRGHILPQYEQCDAISDSEVHGVGQSSRFIQIVS